MPHPLIEKLNADFNEKCRRGDFTEESGEMKEEAVESYLHSRDSAIIEGIEEAMNKYIYENRDKIERLDRHVLDDITQILTSFKQ